MRERRREIKESSRNGRKPERVGGVKRRRDRGRAEMMRMCDPFPAPAAGSSAKQRRTRTRSETPESSRSSERKYKIEIRVVESSDGKKCEMHNVVGGQGNTSPRQPWPPLRRLPPPRHGAHGPPGPSPPGRSRSHSPHHTDPPQERAIIHTPLIIHPSIHLSHRYKTRFSTKPARRPCT